MGISQSRTRSRAITEVDRAVLALKTQKRKLQDYQKKVESSIKLEEEVAREQVRKKETRLALLALKKKKLHEQQLERVTVWTLNVEELIMNLEQSQVQQDVHNHLKQGNDVLKQLQKEASMESIDEILRDTAESAEHWESINRALNDQLNITQLQEVDEELKQMETFLLDEDVLAFPQVPKKIPADIQQAERESNQQEEKQLTSEPMTA